MCRNDEQYTTCNGETWSRGTNSHLPFDVNECTSVNDVSETEGLNNTCETFPETHRPRD